MLFIFFVDYTIYHNEMNIFKTCEWETGALLYRYKLCSYSSSPNTYYFLTKLFSILFTVIFQLLYLYFFSPIVIDSNKSVDGPK